SHLFELASRSQEPVNEPELRALAKAENPVGLKAQFAGRNPAPAGFNQSLPGTLVQFLMMNLMIFGGASIASERADGVLRRLAVAFGNRAGNVASHRSLRSDRLGDGCAAPTYKLRRRLGNGSFRSRRACVVCRRREHRRGEDVQILKCA